MQAAARPADLAGSVDAMHAAGCRVALSPPASPHRLTLCACPSTRSERRPCPARHPPAGRAMAEAPPWRPRWCSLLARQAMQGLRCEV